MKRSKVEENISNDNLAEMLQIVHYWNPTDTLRYENINTTTKGNEKLSYLLLPSVAPLDASGKPLYPSFQQYMENTITIDPKNLYNRTVNAPGINFRAPLSNDTIQNINKLARFVSSYYQDDTLFYPVLLTAPFRNYLSIETKQILLRNYAVTIAANGQIDAFRLLLNPNAKTQVDEYYTLPIRLLQSGEIVYSQNGIFYTPPGTRKLQSRDNSVTIQNIESLIRSIILSNFVPTIMLRELFNYTEIQQYFISKLSDNNIFTDLNLDFSYFSPNVIKFFVSSLELTNGAKWWFLNNAFGSVDAANIFEAVRINFTKDEFNTFFQTVIYRSQTALRNRLFMERLIEELPKYNLVPKIVNFMYYHYTHPANTFIGLTTHDLLRNRLFSYLKLAVSLFTAQQLGNFLSKIIYESSNGGINVSALTFDAKRHNEVLDFIFATYPNFNSFVIMNSE